MRREIQAVEEEAETCASVAEVLLVNRLKSKKTQLNSNKKQIKSSSNLLEDSFNRVAHHEVIVRQLQEHFPQSLLVVLEQAGVIVELLNNFAQVVQRDLFRLRLRIESEFTVTGQ